MRSAVGILALALSLPIAAAEDAGSDKFPTELRGVWDVYPWPCNATETSDSDMRFTIGVQHRENHEDRDTLRSIERVAKSPATWRVFAKSDRDPGNETGEALIYVLKRDTLAVTDGERAEVYVRCK